jgi:DNA topoisomerase-2
VIKETSLKGDYTRITFQPDLSKFGMSELEPDTVALLTKRVYDIAGNVAVVCIVVD